MIKATRNILLPFLVSTLLHAEAVPQKSTTGNSTPYREICKKASFDEATFQNFRSTEAYFHAVECGQEGELAEYLLRNASQKTLSLISEFNKLDLLGNPVKNHIEGFGLFSGTTLRYILFADQISKLFDLPKDYTVVEIGAGFGGQAYILSRLLPFSKYYIYDLPEVEMLINKMTQTLSMYNVACLDAYSPLPEKEVDLFISNYALSECDRNTQLDYLHRVVAKAKRGFMIYNSTNIFEHLSLSDFLAVLQSYGIEPKVHPEPVFTYSGNFLITWDKTKP